MNEDRKTKRNARPDLVAYVLAGAGAIAVVPTAAAEIVYTPADITITQGRLPIDLNNDGIMDFVIKAGFSNGSSLFTAYAVLGGRKTTPEAAVIGNGKGSPLPLSLGEPIGSSSPQSFVPLNNFPILAADSCTFRCRVEGLWAHASEKYLGLRFQIHGETHYGWARLSVSADGYIKVKLEGYAYETTPNHPILAGKKVGFGETSMLEEPESSSKRSLGALAQGAAGR